ncbi:hypothetical protein TraAM80_09879, partial [Trypanosoma rangeli]
GPQRTLSRSLLGCPDPLAAQQCVFALVMVSASKSFFDGSRCIAGAFRRWAAASSAAKRHCVARHFKISRGGRRHAAALLRGTGSPLLSSVDPAGFPLQHLER